MSRSIHTSSAAPAKSTSLFSMRSTAASSVPEPVIRPATAKPSTPTARWTPWIGRACAQMSAALRAVLKSSESSSRVAASARSSAPSAPPRSRCEAGRGVSQGSSSSGTWAKSVGAGLR